MRTTHLSLLIIIQEIIKVLQNDFLPVPRFVHFFFFFKVFGGHTCPFLGPLVPLFWISGDVSSGFQSQSGFAIFAEANVMYIPQDSPPVLHLPTSWRPARSRFVNFSN